MSEEVAAPARAAAPKSGLLVLAIVIALAGTAAYELYQASQLSRSLAEEKATSARLSERIAMLEQQVLETDAKLSEVTKGRLPVSVVFRPDAAHRGIVAFFKNEAPTSIEVSAVLTDPKTSRRQQVRLAIAGDGMQQIGPEQGWAFEPGQAIRLSHATLGAADYTVPAGSPSP